ncbi:hypothetical protein RRV45_18560 [Bacillus sp. DTU_2020_1000418_1_SI_GHA_SEK_038]|uniref:SCP2 sterol-binding domain-containing protein n=1 Tax=Bacillus sp. DTU_2020_1000418_1_SI_GHA_SEK_038 TaxID=3077585 RepID=UPI0028E73FAB|nr:SCP2 sterol-binding domain-containing protein [Bacillus sp. DTU_2020_1000418_1_SI_GHA_SEK_038]WNS74862.1 hypothetical protein RRV45_18560 [Bacillus sp. DTU_2020_1000418_1_SI_GHA_SEK_038]
MENMAVVFIEEVKSKSHLQTLLADSSFSICIKSGDLEIPLIFREGHISINSDDQKQQFDAIISGSKESIHAILTGREKLREAIRWKKVSVDSTFRRLLLLESLFFLCKK